MRSSTIFRGSSVAGLLLVVGVSLSGCGSSGGGSSPPAAPADLSYPSPTTAHLGVPLEPLQPTVAGAVTEWSVDPGLPDGLLLDPESGWIEGTPTALRPLAPYTIAARNAAGDGVEFVLELEVVPVPIPAVSWETGSSILGEAVGGGALIVLLSEPTIHEVIVPFTTSGSATPGADLLIDPGPLVVPAGETMASLLLGAIDDDIAEGVEELEVILGDPIGGVLGATVVHVVTIEDDEGVPVVEFTQDSLAVPESAGSIEIPVGIDPVSAFDTTVTIEVDPAVSSASEGLDFGLAAAEVTIPAGASTATLTLLLHDDADYELEELAGLELVGASGAEVGPGSTLLITIEDDDPLPTASLSPPTASLTEISDPLALTVSLSAASNFEVTLLVETSGTATADDFSVSPTLLVLPPGSLTGLIEVTPLMDVIEEPDETIVITLVAAGGVEVGPAATSEITLHHTPPPPGGLTYSDADAFLALQQPMVPLVPTLAVGAADAWTVDPPLPAGLLLDPMTGWITGTPTVEADPTDHTITATNALGSTTAVVRIRVGMAFLLSGGEVTSSLGATSFVIDITLTESPSGPGAGSFHDIQGWSLGIEIDPSVATVLGAVQSPDVLGINGGSPVDYHQTSLLPTGVTSASVVNFVGAHTLVCDVETGLLEITCQVTAGFAAANPSGATVEFPIVDTLGSPPLDALLVIDTAAVWPELEPCTVNFLP
ncbi:MAG: Calx-beta domain-containing protein [Planctomycetota bacterium]|jgi:hypothetical protein